MSYTQMNRPGAVRSTQRNNQNSVDRPGQGQRRGPYGVTQPLVNPGRGTGRGTSGSSRNSGAGTYPGGYSSRYDDHAGTDSMHTSSEGPEQDGIYKPNEGERRMEYRGSYSVMAPNQKKRAEIVQQAERERREYEAHREANRVTHVNYVGTVGGASVNNPGGRSRLVDEQPGKYQKMEQRNRYRQEAKAREEEEYRIKKEKARQQTERNSQRNRREHADREAAFSEDHRRTNAAFLDRLEGKR